MKLNEILDIIPLDYHVKLTFNVYNARVYDYNCKQVIDPEFLNCKIVGQDITDKKTITFVIEDPKTFKWNYCAKCQTIFKYGIPCPNCGNSEIKIIDYIVINNEPIIGFEEGE